MAAEVLWADQDPTLGEYLKILANMRSFPFEIQTVSTIEEAIDLASQTLPRALVTGHRFQSPPMIRFGYHLLDAPIDGVPLYCLVPHKVVHTAAYEAELPELYRRYGATFIPKGFGKSTTRVLELLERKIADGEQHRIWTPISRRTRERRFPTPD